jgi:hypothetical protein
MTSPHLLLRSLPEYQSKCSSHCQTCLSAAILTRHLLFFSLWNHSPSSLCGFTLYITCFMLLLSSLECNYVGTDLFNLNHFQGVQCWGMPHAFLSVMSILLLPIVYVIGIISVLQQNDWGAKSNMYMRCHLSNMLPRALTLKVYYQNIFIDSSISTLISLFPTISPFHPDCSLPSCDYSAELSLLPVSPHCSHLVQALP